MNPAATSLLVAAALVALVDWWAVATEWRKVEWIAKPLTLLLLIGVAGTIDAASGAVQAWFLAALVLSLAGDIFLMLPRNLFLAGLASFLLAHLVYIAGFITAGLELAPAIIALVVALVAVRLIGSRILTAASARDRRLRIPVAAYIAVISLMAIAAAATGNAVALLGAVSFYCSDALLGWNRFVARLPQGRLLTMVTYHLAQALLVVVLVTL